MPSYLLKVTKFLGKISQFEFLVMIFIPDFNLFFMRKLQPPSPLKNLSQQPLSKSWGPDKPPFMEIWLEAQPPCRKGGGGGVHTMKRISDWHHFCKWKFL